MILLKIFLLITLTSSLLMSVWKISIGVLVPLLLLWGYGWITGFVEFSEGFLLIFTFVHLVFQFTVWRISNTRRDATLAFTGMGVIGFALGILSSLFFGALMGFFLWLGSVGRLITQPLSLGIRNIVLSFMAGVMKVMYGIIIGGVISYLLF